VLGARAAGLDAVLLAGSDHTTGLDCRVTASIPDLVDDLLSPNARHGN